MRMTRTLLETLSCISLSLLMAMNTSALQRDTSVINTTRFPEPQTLPEAVLEFCTDSLYCPVPGDQTHSAHRKNLCCLPCDCSESCYAAGTCCLDVPSQTSSANKTDKIKENCVETYVGKENVKSGLQEINAYMLVQDCSIVHETRFADDDVILKCLQPDENVLQEMLPVYSEKTGQHYRNLFCAACNNDENDTVPWELHFTSYTFENAMKAFVKVYREGDLLKTIRNESKLLLQFKPVNNRAKHCFNEIISECTKTSHTSAFADLCRKVYSPVRGDNAIYKNVFCLKCNEMAFSVMTELMCKGVLITASETQFSTILGPAAYAYKSELTSQTESCPRELTYDKALKTCILKSCPVSEVQVGQQCLTVIQNVTGVSLDYRLKLLFPIKGFTLPKSETIDTFVRPYVLHDGSFFVCNLQILKVEALGKHMAVRIRVIKKRLYDSYESFNIYEEFLMLKRKIVSLNQESVKGSKPFFVELDNFPYQPINSKYANFAVYDSDYIDNCGSSIALSHMQFCDAVVVTKYKILNGVIIVNNVSFQPGEYIFQMKDGNGNKPVHICYDLYLSKILPQLPSIPNAASTNEYFGTYNICTFIFFIILLF